MSHSTKLGDAAQAIALARRCVQKNPRMSRGVCGSALQFEKAMAARSRVDGSIVGTSVWTVSIPESGLDEVGRPVQMFKPSGRDLEVDLATGACRSLPMD